MSGTVENLEAFWDEVNDMRRKELTSAKTTNTTAFSLLVIG